MNISAINNNMISQSMDTAKKQVQNNEFEKQLKKAYDEKDKNELKEVCRQFEQIFLNYMFKQMRATVPKSDLLQSNFAQDTFQDMLDERITQEVAEGPGMGLGDMLYKSLERDLQSKYVPTNGNQDIHK